VLNHDGTIGLEALGELNAFVRSAQQLRKWELARRSSGCCRRSAGTDQRSPRKPSTRTHL
jgi:hypothetical protein